MDELGRAAPDWKEFLEDIAAARGSAVVVAEAQVAERFWSAGLSLGLTLLQPDMG